MHSQRKPFSSGTLRYLLTALVVGTAYYYSARFGLSLAVVVQQVTSVWPPTGIALAAVAIFGYRMWLPIWMAAFCINAVSDEPFFTAAGIATGNTLEAVVGVFLLKRIVQFQPDLNRLRDVVGLAFWAAAISTMVSASLGTLSLRLGGAIETGQMATVWMVWWLGDAMGALLVAPLLLTWSAGASLRLTSKWRLAELSALFVFLVLVAYITLSSPLAAHTQIKYMVFPFFVWSALRFGQAVTATAVCVVASVAIWGATTETVAFPAEDLHSRLILLQTFMGVVSMTSLALGAVTAERAHVDHALRQSEQRLRLALRASRMGTWSNDLIQGRVVWSPELEEIFGLQPNTFPGTEEAFFNRIFAEDRERVRDVFQNAILSRSEYEVEFRFIRPDGQIRWLVGRGQAFYDDRGQPVRLAGIGMDITERKRVEEELARYRNQLEELVTERTEALGQSLLQLRRSERLASLGTLAAGIAHEINNPLNSILLSAEYVQYEHEDSELGQAIRTIRSEAQRAGKIVHGILKFAREEKTSKTAEDLNKVVRHAAELAKTYMDSPMLGIELQLGQDLPSALMDQTEIEQVIINLIKNAVEAAKRPVQIVIRTVANDEGVCMEIEDDGPGIPEEALPYIFDPFYTTRRRSGGTGLGLSICHGIITEHGGTISARSRVGRGTTVSIALPVATTESIT